MSTVSELLTAYKQQNNKLQELKDKHDVEFTRQTYLLDGIQNTLLYTKILTIIYYLFVVIFGAMLLFNNPNMSIYTKGVFILIITIFPYIIYPIESWIMNILKIN